MGAITNTRKWYIDIANIGGKSTITDTLSLVHAKNYCIFSEFAVHVQGFDNPKDNFAQQVNIVASRKLANSILTTMRGPRGLLTTSYLFIYNANCCTAEAAALRKFIPLPQGHYLEIP